MSDRVSSDRDPEEPETGRRGPAAVWWVSFSAEGYPTSTQRVEWMVDPDATPGAYAARRLYQLSRLRDPVIPPPSAGPVQCLVYAADPDDPATPPGPPIGQAGRMFRPTDAVAHA